MDPRLKAARLRSKEDPGVDAEALEQLKRGQGTLGAAMRISAEELLIIRRHGLACLNADRFDDARAVFEALIALGDFDPGVAFMLANACQRQGDLRAAVAHFERGLAGCGEEHEALKSSALEWGRALVAGSLVEGDAR